MGRGPGVGGLLPRGARARPRPLGPPVPAGDPRARGGGGPDPDDGAEPRRTGGGAGRRRSHLPARRVRRPGGARRRGARPLRR